MVLFVSCAEKKKAADLAIRGPVTQFLNFAYHSFVMVMAKSRVIGE